MEEKHIVCKFTVYFGGINLKPFAAEKGKTSFKPRVFILAILDAGVIFIQRVPLKATKTVMVKH